MSNEELEKAVERNDFTFLTELDKPNDKIEVLALQTGLDSILWHALRDPTINVKNIKFPTCF